MPSQKRKEILISDLSIWRPQSALGNRYAPGKWKLLPCEHDDFSGVMPGTIVS